MNLDFKIGSEVQSLHIEDAYLQDILMASSYESKESEEEIIKKALDEPIESKSLEEIVKPGQKIAIVTSDITRPMPTFKVLPEILKRLYKAGIKKEDISLTFALGSHRGHSLEEQKHLAGECFSEILCRDSNPEDLVHLGYTKAGTPCDFDRVVASADVRIALGNVEFHYFAGYSGGAKAFMPGVSNRNAIQANHKMMTNANACAGKLEGNPVREDIEEAVSKLGVDFILNVVLDAKKNIIFAAAGDVTKAHRRACSFLDKLYRKPISKKADIVVVSQGGAPKDLNLYQTQKALDNAKHAVKDGGTVILIGACKEGLGEKTFEKWMLEAKKPEDLIKRVQENFQLGGHKAAAIALVLEKADIYLVSSLTADFVRKIFLTPFSTVQEAYDAALLKFQSKEENKGKNPSVLAMPYGGSTLPVIENPF